MITTSLTWLIVLSSFISAALFIRLAWHTYYFSRRAKETNEKVHLLLLGLSVLFVLAPSVLLFWPAVLWVLPLLLSDIARIVVFQVIATVFYVALILSLAVGTTVWWNYLFGVSLFRVNPPKKEVPLVENEDDLSLQKNGKDSIIKSEQLNEEK